MAGMPLLSGQQYMRGPGVDDSGPAIQLPANGPSPLSLVRAVVSNTADGSQPAVAPAAPVASGGVGGPTMTPQQLVAAKQASVAPAMNGLGMALIGQGAMKAGDDAGADFAAGNYAGTAGDVVRGIGLGLGHAVAAPVVAIHDVASNIAGHAANLVGGFIGGLAGHSTAPVAAPATAAAAPQPATAGMPISPYYPTADLPSPRAGVRAFRRANGGIGYVADDSVKAAGQGGGMPTGQAAQPQEQQLAVEKAMGLPAGTMRGLVAAAPPNQRFAMLGQINDRETTARQNEMRGMLADHVLSTFKASQAPQQKGESAADFAKRQSEGYTRFANQALALVSPQAIQPTNTYNTFEQQ